MRQVRLEVFFGQCNKFVVSHARARDDQRLRLRDQCSKVRERFRGKSVELGRRAEERRAQR